MSEKPTGKDALSPQEDLNQSESELVEAVKELGKGKEGAKTKVIQGMVDVLAAKTRINPNDTKAGRDFSELIHLR